MRPETVTNVYLFPRTWFIGTLSTVCVFMVAPLFVTFYKSYGDEPWHLDNYPGGFCVMLVAWRVGREMNCTGPWPFAVPLPNPEVDHVRVCCIGDSRHWILDGWFRSTYLWWEFKWSDLNTALFTMYYYSLCKSSDLLVATHSTNANIFTCNSVTLRFYHLGMWMQWWLLVQIDTSQHTSQHLHHRCH